MGVTVWGHRGEVVTFWGQGWVGVMKEGVTFWVNVGWTRGGRLIGRQMKIPVRGAHTLAKSVVLGRGWGH